MSLWTPGGEVPVHRDRPAADEGAADGRDGMAGLAGAPGLEDLSPEERAQAEQVIAEMAEVQRQLLAVPAAQVVANHVMGLYELAALHLTQDRPRLPEARLAIDAMVGVLDATAGRLADAEAPLRQAVNQLQVAYVQRDAAGGGAAAPGEGDPTEPA